MEVVISVAGERKANASVQRVAKNMSSTAVVWPEVMEVLAAAEDQSWGRGVKLADSTIERKAEAGRPEKLVWSGALLDTLAKAQGGDHAIRKMGPYEMEFGSGLFYARFLQRGTKKMSRKRVLRFSRATRLLVSELVMRHIIHGG